MKQNLLIQTVLASTLFASQVGAATSPPISTVTSTNQNTTATGNIEITSTGQVVVNVGEAITVNTSATSITLDANNMYTNAILTNGPGGTYGIDIVNGNTGQSAVVDVGVGTGIKANTDGILIDNIAATVDSYGTIVGGNSAINITANGQTATVTNETTGVMSGTAAPTILVQTGGTGLTLANSGKINTLGAQDAIQLNDSFTSIVNNGTGTIQSTSAAGIDIAGATPITGSITNFGNIITSGAGNAIYVNNTFNGTIQNAAGANIITNGTGDAIKLAGAFTSLTNSGVIQATAAVGTAIDITATSTSGTIINTGIIQSNNESAISLGGSITQIANSGTIQSTALTAGSAVIQSTAAVKLTGGIINSGNISNNNVAGTNAIDLSFAGTSVQLFQTGGTITGNVLLAPFGSTGLPGAQNVFTMSGGQITGNVTAANVAGNQNVLTLGAGLITGNVTLGNQGDTLNLNGTVIGTATAGSGVINGGTGNDTFNLSFGSFNQLNGGGGKDTINVSGNFTALSQTGGNINGVGTINVANNANFYVDMPITGMTGGTLTVMPGGGLIANANITGTSGIVNNGAIEIESGNTIDVSGAVTGTVTNNGDMNVLADGLLKAYSYTQTAGSAFEVQLQNAANFGQIQTVGPGVQAVNLEPNSTIRPFTNGVFIPSGTTFNVIQASNGGTITDNSLVVPYSVVLFFDKTTVACGAGNTCVQLKTERIPYSVLSATVLGQEVGNVLDILESQAVINPDLLNLLGQLDTSTTVGQLDDYLISLAPIVNGAMVMQSRAVMTAAFKSVERRLEDLRNLRPLGEEDYILKRNGVNYGDCFDEEARLTYTADVPQGGLWIKGFGDALIQKTRNQIEGYTGSITGGAIGGDWGLPNIATLGFAVGRANSNTIGKTDDANVIDGQSNQFIVYGWFNPMEPIYVDVMLGLATNTYDTRRNIGIVNIATSSFAHFFGLEYGAQMDVGYGFNYDGLVVSPIARVKYTRLEMDSYTESGAGGLSLAVSSEGLNELILGAGLRALGKMDYAQALYYPEASILFFYDFYADREELVADFLGFGNVGFPVTGIKPKHTGLLLGVGVTAHYHDHYVFTTKYDLELRDHFFGNSAYIQLEYQWY